MNNQLVVTTELINEKVKFLCTTRDNPEVIVDYNEPIGDGEGYTSLELFLISIATCSGTSVKLLLGKMQKHVDQLKVIARGQRRDTHPTYFETIHLYFEVTSEDVTALDLDKALKISEEGICPVWNMIKDTVAISYNYEIMKV